MNKKYKNTGTLEDLVLSDLKTEADIKEWLTISLEEFLEDGDLNAFCRTLEYAVKAKDTISGMSQKTGISRSNLYALFKGESQPQMKTVLKVIKELGYTLKVA
ncbi:MAG: putative addiction module antidote protein [Acidobacteriota bacterium]|nr:putative addiction module antidote protein [Acidobacteriota bacterium]